MAGCIGAHRADDRGLSGTGEGGVGHADGAVEIAPSEGEADAAVCVCGRSEGSIGIAPAAIRQHAVTAASHLEIQRRAAHRLATVSVNQPSAERGLLTGLKHGLGGGQAQRVGRNEDAHGQCLEHTGERAGGITSGDLDGGGLAAALEPNVIVAAVIGSGRRCLQSAIARQDGELELTTADGQPQSGIRKRALNQAPTAGSQRVLIRCHTEVVSVAQGGAKQGEAVAWNAQGASLVHRNLAGLRTCRHGDGAPAVAISRG